MQHTPPKIHEAPEADPNVEQKPRPAGVKGPLHKDKPRVTTDEPQVSPKVEPKPDRPKVEPKPDRPKPEPKPDRPKADPKS